MRQPFPIQQFEPLVTLRNAITGTHFEGTVFAVGGFVRDVLRGGVPGNDIDLVTTVPALDLAEFLVSSGISRGEVITYPRFGTAMVRVDGQTLELATARKESYSPESRKPDVEAATLTEDAQRRDFTVNALMVGLHDGVVVDELGTGLADLAAKILRTPLEPIATFSDDPLRMLRAVRFRWQLGFEPAPGLYEAITASASRLPIISAERVQDEIVKMLKRGTAADALADLMRLGLLHDYAPELEALRGVEQGNYHHLDAWDHTLLAVRNLGECDDVVLMLGTLLHDVGKPPTRKLDEGGKTRFFNHEVVGAEIATTILRRLKFSGEVTARVARLVRNHMRLGSSPQFSASAARRVIRDLGEDVDRLLAVVDADCRALKPGLKTMDLEAIRTQLEEVMQATPREALRSPLSGSEIMTRFGFEPGPEIGEALTYLTEQVLSGELAVGDKDSGYQLLTDYFDRKRSLST